MVCTFKKTLQIDIELEYDKYKKETAFKISIAQFRHRS